MHRRPQCFAIVLVLTLWTFAGLVTLTCGCCVLMGGTCPGVCASSPSVLATPSSSTSVSVTLVYVHPPCASCIPCCPGAHTPTESSLRLRLGSCLSRDDCDAIRPQDTRVPRVVRSLNGCMPVERGCLPRPARGTPCAVSAPEAAPCRPSGALPSPGRAGGPSCCVSACTGRRAEQRERTA